MAFDLNLITGKSTDISVTIFDQTAVVSYVPAALTQENLNLMRGDAPTSVPATPEEATAEDVAPAADTVEDDTFVTFFQKIVSKWDVVMNGEIVPLTHDGLYKVPMVLLRAIYLKIMEAAGSGEVGSLSSSG